MKDLPVKPGGRTPPLLLLGLLALPLWFWLGWAESLPERSQPLPYLTLHALLWFNFSLLLSSLGLLGGARRALGRGDWALLLLFPLLFHALAMLPAPLLETDPYRYLWDGKQLIHGFNPYLQAPLQGPSELGKPWYFELINHPDLATIYPPLAQAMFALSALLVEDSLLAWKILTSLMGLGAMTFLGLALKALGKDPRAVAFLAWNPLWIKEFANSGHMDTVMLLPLAVAAWALASQREKLAALALGFSALGKWLSLGLLGAWAAATKRRARLLLVPATILAGLLPFFIWQRWSGPFETLGTFGRDWLFHAFIYDMVYKGGQALGLSAWAAGLAGKGLALALLGGFSIFLLARARRPAQALAGAYWLAVLLLLSSQVIFPWYVSLALLLAPFAASLRAAWLWTLLAPLSYTYYLAWQPIFWLKYLSFALLSLALWFDWQREKDTFTPGP